MLKSKKLSLSLYRSLLRLGKAMDSNPASKLLLFRKQASVSGKLSHNSTAKYYQHVLLRRLFPHDEMKLFSPLTMTSVSLSDVIREEFSRMDFELDEKYDSTVRVDAAFAALRKLSTVWKAYESMEAFGSVVKDQADNDDSNSDSNNSSSISASTTKYKKTKEKTPQEHSCEGAGEEDDDSLQVTPHSSVLMPGVLLAAHPMVKGPLHRAVILLLDHNTQGTYGVVLNRPTSHTLDTAVKNLPAPLLDSFGRNRVSFGGMIRRLQYLHDIPEAGEGSIELPLCKQQLFAGGDLDTVLSLVENDPSLVKRFHFFVGCCTWHPQQLEDEIEQGYWIPLRTHADDALKLSAKMHSLAEEPQEEGHGLGLDRVETSGDGSRSGYNTAAGIGDDDSASIDVSDSNGHEGAAETNGHQSLQELLDSINQLEKRAKGSLNEEAVTAAAAAATDAALSSTGAPLRSRAAQAEMQREMSTSGSDGQKQNLWSHLLAKTGGAYRACPKLPYWVDAGCIDSCDWK